MSIKLAIGCYNKLLGEALKKLIAGDRDIKIVGMFTSGTDVKEFAKADPEILLLDLQTFQSLPKQYSLPPKTKILLLGDSSHRSPIPGWFDDLIGKGVAGILPSEVDIRILKKAVKAVSSGELWFEKKVLGQMIYHSALERKHREKLSDQEKKVADLICQGCKNKEIAQSLNISEQTVKAHCNRIYKKMEVSGRLQLAIKLGNNRNP
jgi:DNA-binding NarL/FixJ family response regulator